MLADVLTKLKCERELISYAMSTGFWKLQPSEETEQQKKRIREGGEKRKAQRKADAEDR
jgi:hypothetical protein